MRRALCTGISCVCLLLCTLSGLSPSRASGDVCFTAVNITVLPLSADTMPVWYAGVLFVPYTVFSAPATGVSLGVNSIYGQDSETVSVFNLNDMLIFDLRENITYNQRTREEYTSTAFLRNGIPYLPAALVCEFFSLNPPSYFYTPYGYVARITDLNQRLSDSAFADAGSEVLRNRLRDYTQSLTPQTPAEEMPAPVPEPAPPSYSPPQAAPQPTQPDEQAPEPVEEIPVCLAFRCGEADTARAIAQLLEGQSLRGLFFFAPETLETQGECVRYLLGAGHSVGLSTQAETEESALEELRLGEVSAEVVAHSRCLFALTPRGDLQDQGPSGWHCWDARQALNAVTPSAVQRSLRLPRDSGAVPLLLTDSRADTAAVSSLLSILRSLHCTVLLPEELLMETEAYTF